MQMTKAELEKKLRDKEAVISRLENDLRHSLATNDAHVLELRKKLADRTNDANCRGALLTFIVEKYFTFRCSG